MNKNFVFIAITAFAFAFLLMSCDTAPNSKEQYIEDYAKFMKDIHENKNEFTEADWKKKDEEFQKFSVDLYSEFSEKMGLIEQAKIAKNAIAYASARGTSALREATNNGDLSNAFDELTNLWNDDVKADFDATFNDLKKVWDDDLKGKVESKLDEVKKILEDEEFRGDIKSKIEDIKEIVNDEQLKGKVEDVMKELEEVFQEIEDKIEE